MRTPTLLVALFLTGCSSDPEVPSCQAGVTAYYDAGCVYQDLSTGDTIPAADVIDLCRDTLSVDSCSGELDTWLLCLDSVDPDTCDCNSELEDLISC
jgi:hypothetical protein